MLGRYFTLGQNFDIAQAYDDQAGAYLSPKDTAKTLLSLQAALVRKGTYPNVKTSAWSRFAILVATHRIRSHSAQVLDVLAQNQSPTLVPIERFNWYAARALTAAEQKDGPTAREHSVKALETAQLNHSGFRYHPKLGLVGPELAPLKENLLQLSRL
jgi:hypothetical protein